MWAWFDRARGARHGRRRGGCGGGDRSDEWDPRASESERERVRNGVDGETPLVREKEQAGARERARCGADRWDPLSACTGARGQLAGPDCALRAEFRFYFSPEFLKAFLFIFSMDF
jgi:hypothetical protein